MLEKRFLERFELPLPAAIEVDRELTSEVFNLTARNISSSGAYFETPTPLDVGTRVHIDLVLAVQKFVEQNEAAACVSLKGRVIRVETGGMAIRFEPRFRIRRIGRIEASRRVRMNS